MRGTPTDDDIRVALIAGYLAEYGSIFDMFGATLAQKPEIFDIFEKALEDAPVEVLRWALAEWVRVGKKFPAPGDISQLIRERMGVEAWDRVRWMLKTFHFDEGGFKPISVGKDAKIGVSLQALSIREEYKDGFLLRPKPLNAAAQYAVERIGGLKRIQEIGAQELEFARKHFIEAHASFTTHRAMIGPTKDEARQLLAGLEEKAK